MKILCIQNHPVEGFGLYQTYLEEKNVEYKILHAFDNPEYPEINEINVILIAGTPIPAYEIQKYNFLIKESEFLRKAIQNGIPCFGSCFGGQILSLLLGGRVTRNPVMEIGTYRVRSTEFGKHDPYLKGFPDQFPVFHWHGDTFSVPPGAELLVKGEDCKNQMFRKNNIIGVQFHLEITGEDTGRWAQEYKDELTEFGKTKDQILNEHKEYEQDLKQLAYQLLSNFLQSVV